jgi:O-antigen/teichoic acid export membrane protein
MCRACTSPTALSDHIICDFRGNRGVWRGTPGGLDSRELASAAPMSPSSEATVLPPRFRRNVVSVYATFAVSAVILLVMTPVLVRGLGKDDFGLWVVLTSIAPYATLLDLGLGSATTKYVAEYHGRDVGLTSRTVSTSFATLSVIGLAILVVGVPFSFAFPTLFNVGGDDDSSATVAMLIFTVGATVSLPARTFEATLMGVQRYDITNFSILAVLAAQAVAWTVVLSAGGGIIELAAATVGLHFAGHVARFVAMRRILPAVRVSPALFERRAAARLMRLSGWIAVGEATTVVIHRIDPVVVALVAGVPAAGVYAVGQRLAIGVDGVIRPTLTGFFPHASRLFGYEDSGRLRAAMLAGTRLTLAVAGPVSLTVVILAQPIIDAWVGDGFGSAGPVAVFLVLGMAIAAVTRTGFLMLQGAGRQRTTAKMSAIEAILNLGLSIALGLTFGLIGVAVATFVATVVTRSFLIVPYVCRAFGVKITSFLSEVARAHLLPIAATLALGWLLRRENLSDVGALVASAAALVATYLVTFAATGLRERERNRLLAAARGGAARAVSRISANAGRRGRR